MGRELARACGPGIFLRASVKTQDELESYVTGFGESLDLELAFTGELQSIYRGRAFYVQGRNWGRGFGARPGKTSKQNLSVSSPSEAEVR